VVGEKSQQGPPNAYIYQYPSLTLEQTLEHGTEQAYSAAAFNQSGDRLATVGSYPDFMLTVWDWRSGCTLLRSKAFSQEVYCVSFCPYADVSLVTSGLISVLSGYHGVAHRHAAHINSTCIQCLCKGDKSLALLCITCSLPSVCACLAAFQMLKHAVVLLHRLFASGASACV